MALEVKEVHDLGIEIARYRWRKSLAWRTCGGSRYVDRVQADYTLECLERVMNALVRWRVLFSKALIDTCAQAALPFVSSLTLYPRPCPSSLGKRAYYLWCRHWFSILLNGYNGCSSCRWSKQTQSWWLRMVLTAFIMLIQEDKTTVKFEDALTVMYQ